MQDTSNHPHMSGSARIKKGKIRSVRQGLTGDTRKIFVSNITVDESNSARVLIGCKPIRQGPG